MEKKFSASFKKKGKDLYNIALEAILNLDLKLVSEDVKRVPSYKVPDHSPYVYGGDPPNTSTSIKASQSL